MKRTVNRDDETIRIMKKIAHNIRKLRIKEGLTQEDMSKLGFGARWYQRLESGKHIPTLPTLIKLSRNFQVDLSEFFK